MHRYILSNDIYIHINRERIYRASQNRFLLLNGFFIFTSVMFWMCRLILISAVICDNVITRLSVMQLAVCVCRSGRRPLKEHWRADVYDQTPYIYKHTRPNVKTPLTLSPSWTSCVTNHIPRTHLNNYHRVSGILYARINFNESEKSEKK